MVSCTKSGNVYDEKYGVCPRCGEKFVPAAEPAPDAPKYVPIQNMGQQKEKAAGKKKKGKTKLIIILAIVCVLIIGTVIALVMIFGSNNTAAEAQEQISLGDKYFKNEEYDDAIVSFQKAIDIDPYNDTTYIKLSDSYEAIGNRHESVRTLEKGYDMTSSGEIKTRLDELSAKTSLEAMTKDVKVKENGSIDGLNYTIYENGVTAIEGTGSIGDKKMDEVTFRNKKVTEVFLKDGVSEIGKYAFRDCDTITCIHIPASVTSIGEWAFNDSDRLTAIEVDPANNYYSSDDGVLYNKDKTVLENYPSGKWGTYTLPMTVTTVQTWAFTGASHLRYIGVEAGNENYSGSDGVLFNKDYTSIICYPAGRIERSGSYEIPDTVTNIAPHAFYACNDLEIITVPDSVKSVQFHAFEKLTNDQTIYLKNRNYVPSSWNSKWQYKCKAEIKTEDSTTETSSYYDYDDEPSAAYPVTPGLGY